MKIRALRKDDAPFLREMSSFAARWRLGQESGDGEEVLEDDHVARYVEAWGRPGDLGMVAEIDGRPVGAAWVRPLPPDRPGYGFIDERTPELSVAVVPDERGRGVGSGLVQAVLEAAQRAGYGAVSLSVERDNPALRLYERLGSEKVTRSGGSWTMRFDLEPQGGRVAN
ncbi:MAG: GNAT family N-acetyltransferase [Actinomycetota bacterium]